MWLVAGLGNPGDEYAETRHNIGFRIVEAVAEEHSIALKLNTPDYIFGRGFIGKQKAVLVKPLTFMNRSGIAVKEVFRKFDDIEDILVIHDDLDLDTGVIRIKRNSSSGGHNGVQSIIDSLGTRDFTRLRIGISRPERGPVERYVLRKFSKQEKPLIDEAVVNAADAVKIILNKGVSHAQNVFHRDVK